MTVMLKMILSLAAVLAIFRPACSPSGSSPASRADFLSRRACPPSPWRFWPSEFFNQEASLIRCLDRKVLVGATNTQISHLADIAEEEAESDEDSFNSVFNEKGTAKSENGIKSQISNSLREIARV